MRKCIVQAALCLSFSHGGLAGEAGGHPYEPAMVTLQGVLELEPKFGPPNYGESPATDKRMCIYVLRLEQPIIVGTRATLSELNDKIVANVSRVQLVFDGKAPDAIAAAIGKTASLRGSLSGQATGHHFYPMLTVSSWESVQDGRENVSFCQGARKATALEVESNGKDG